jgi:hypothetical protein
VEEAPKSPEPVKNPKKLSTPKKELKAKKRISPKKVSKDYGIRLTKDQSVKCQCCLFLGFKSVIMAWVTVNIFTIPLYLGII